MKLTTLSITLAQVMREKYVVYFMTAGTKPPQPKVVYCPHSHDAASHQIALDYREEYVVSKGTPSSPSNHGLTGHHEPSQHVISSRGVHWALEDGKIAPKLSAFE
mgnify:CR=1 FL=1|mmetsp:Transcript_17217/g.52047  ORF Transcript_17217/g.52047 Transcript_17217/m.52047 type:complete len:105 (-) Transcript_17217:81-395(-)|eukprot:scaffold162104_cov39-Tisochrysis_lutea.AAC.1